MPPLKQVEQVGLGLHWTTVHDRKRQPSDTECVMTLKFSQWQDGEISFNLISWSSIRFSYERTKQTCNTLLLPFANRFELFRWLMDLLMLVRHHLNMSGTKQPMYGWFHQLKTICICMYINFGLLIWERRGGYRQISLLKKEDDNQHLHSAVYSLEYTYSTININRLREDWRRNFMDT